MPERQSITNSATNSCHVNDAKSANQPFAKVPWQPVADTWVVQREAGTELAARLRAAMNYAKGTTLADVAKATGLSRSTVGTWSSNEYVPVNRLSSFGKVAELCGLPVEFFTADLQQVAQLPTDARFVTQDEVAAGDHLPLPKRPRFPSERADEERDSEAR
jgi:transcriptional regulator with XRE-family HTH domain